MGIDLPELDDREHEEILEQAKKLIPAFSEEWTDFNPHDPGITVLEVLAWLTETHTYQLDQITDRHREKYLRLIGHRPQPPTPATAPIEFQGEETVAGTRLPAGTRLAVTDGIDNLYQFETEQDIVFTDVSIDQVYTIDRTGVSDHAEANQIGEMFYLPFGDEIDQDTTLYLGFDGDPFEAADQLTLSVMYHDDNLPEPAPAPDGEPAFEPSVELAWEYYSPYEQAWQPLTVAVDQTNVLYEGGLVELRRDDGQEEPPIDGEQRVPAALSSHRYWVRCRVQSPGYEIPPQVDAIKTNVVTASHAATVTGETLQRLGSQSEYSSSPTLDGQQYVFANKPVLSASVYVDGEEFREVSDFDASGPDDPHYLLERERGQVVFGDGTKGRVPEPDATVTAEYVYGGGSDGNVSTSAVWGFAETERQGETALPLNELQIEPLAAASGGEDAETVDEALRRARRDLRRPYRAVTEADYRYLASHTPGLRIGRTGVWRDNERTTVIVVPYAPPDVQCPEASDAFLDTVRDHLIERTLMTDRLTVTGPRYVRLELTVTGGIRRRFAQSGYESAITEAITSYLHPLTGYEGEGWPFGRALEFDELEAQIEAVDAVDHISDISITAHGGTVADGKRVEIDKGALFSVADVSVEMITSSGGR